MRIKVHSRSIYKTSLRKPLVLTRGWGEVGGKSFYTLKSMENIETRLGLYAPVRGCSEPPEHVVKLILRSGAPQGG